MNITIEQGKTLKGSRGDVLRGLGQCWGVFLIAIGSVTSED